jgi:hypothetical protein
MIVARIFGLLFSWFIRWTVKRAYRRYCSSVTFFFQSTGERFSFSWIAIWLMAVVGLAP